MQDNSFFDKPTEQSKVKTRIVDKYFEAWANVIIPQAKKWKSNIGYVDLFAGPGKYNDGFKSTPVLVLEKAIGNKDMRNMLVSAFNDIDLKSVQNLEGTISSIPGIDVLKHKPLVTNTEVSGEGLDRILDHVKTIPTLFFVDPWGYKGLSLKLIISALQNWGCDCIFFFNYRRIIMSINNPFVEEHMDSLFGKERVADLRNLPTTLNSSEKELSVIETISQALKEKAGQYVLPFRFKSDSGKRSSHHLIFVSKHIRGYEIMKKIMANESTDSDQGVPSFEYNPASLRQPLLFELSRPLDDLAEMLLTNYAGRTMTMKQIFDDHNVGTPFLPKNYKHILSKLESEGIIQTDPPANKRIKRKGEVTFADRVKVTFPPKEEPKNGS